MYEIDFLPVGDGEHGGDAIALYSPKGNTFWRHSADVPARGWVDAVALAFSNQVEE